MSSDSLHWYVLQVYSNLENKVKDEIIKQAAKKDLSDEINEIIIPTIQYNENKKGKNIVVEKKTMPGYMLINMKMSDMTWHLIKNIPSIIGFLGNQSKPKPITQAEKDKMLNFIENESKVFSASKLYTIGKRVNIIDGPFEGFEGLIEEVDSEKSRLKLSVSIFGRPTRIDLNYDQVRKSE